MTTRIPAGKTEWPEIDREACLEAIRNWMDTKRHDDKVYSLRKQLVLRLLHLFDKSRASDLSDKQMADFMSTLGMEAPGKKQHMPGLATPYTPGPRQARMIPNSVERTETNPIERLRNERAEQVQAKRAAEDLADERGELWTIVAAYHDDQTFVMFFQGRMSDDWYDAFVSQHTDAAAHLEPYTLTGKMSDVRAQASKITHGVSTKDLTIRTLLKKDNRK